jgi:hypothetical protein
MSPDKLGIAKLIVAVLSAVIGLLAVAVAIYIARSSGQLKDPKLRMYVQTKAF